MINHGILIILTSLKFLIVSYNDGFIENIGHDCIKHKKGKKCNYVLLLKFLNESCDKFVIKNSFSK